MPAGIGFSFAPGSQDIDMQGGGRLGGARAQPGSSVEVKSLRLPKRDAPGSVAPLSLLGSQGGAGAPAGFDPQFINLLASAFGQAPQGQPQGMLWPQMSGMLPQRPQAQQNTQRVNVPGLDSGLSNSAPSAQSASNAPPLTWDSPDVQDFLRRNPGDDHRLQAVFGQSIAPQAPRIIVDRSQGPAGGLF
jgi:hypothetical protein